MGDGKYTETNVETLSNEVLTRTMRIVSSSESESAQNGLIVAAQDLTDPPRSRSLTESAPCPVLEIEAEGGTHVESSGERSSETSPRSMHRRLFGFVRSKSSEICSNFVPRRKSRPSEVAEAVLPTSTPALGDDTAREVEAEEKGDVLKKMVSCFTVCLKQKTGPTMDEEHEQYAPLFPYEKPRSKASSLDSDPQRGSSYQKLV